MTGWYLGWIVGLTVIVVLLFWWSIVDDTRIKRLEGDSD